MPLICFFQTSESVTRSIQNTMSNNFILIPLRDKQAIHPFNVLRTVRLTMCKQNSHMLE